MKKPTIIYSEPSSYFPESVRKEIDKKSKSNGAKKVVKKKVVKKKK